jgi:hypothetical protein
MNHPDILIHQRQHQHPGVSQEEQEYRAAQYHHAGPMSKPAVYQEWSTTTTFVDVDPSLHHHHHHQEVYNVLGAAMDYDHHKRPAIVTDEQPDSKRLRIDDAFFPSPVAAAAATIKKVHNEQWDAMFERLRAYKVRYGNCLVPKRFSEDPKLGTWVETQVSLNLFVNIFFCST